MAISTAAAIIGGAALSAGGAVLAGKSSKKAADNATQAQMDATAANNALTEKIYNQNAATLRPFIQSGTSATNALNVLAGLGDATQRQQYENVFEKYRNSTGYDFRFGEGMRGVNALAAAGGYRDSGAAVKSAMRFGQGIASDEYNNYLALLANQQGVGLSAAGAQAGVGTNYVSAISNNNNAAASALGNNALLAGNAKANMWGSIAGAGTNALGNLFASSFAPRNAYGIAGSSGIY